MGDYEELKELLEYAVSYGKNKETKPDVAKFCRLTALTTPAKILELLSELKDFQWGASVEAEAGDEARAEVARLKSELECARGDIRTSDQIIERLKKDANRYRWLRSDTQGKVITLDGRTDDHIECLDHLSAEELDALIDAEISEESI